MAWIGYTSPSTGLPGRYDPATGEVQQYGGSGNWVKAGTVGESGDYTPSNPKINPPDQTVINQIMASRAAAASKSAGAPAGTTPAGGVTAAQSYYMAGAPGGTAGTTGGAGAAGGGGGTTQMATTSATQIPTNVSIPEWQTWFGQNVGKTILVNGQPRTIGTDIQPNEMLQAFQNNTVGWGSMPGASGAQQPAQAIGGPGQAQPESVALGQMAQIDPATEALRQGLAGSYLGPLAQAALPSAQQFQSYLDLAQQVDPTSAAARAQLGTDLAAQEALGTQLDPATQREVEQATRRAQLARGNVYGTPQMVQEAMTRGQAGLALQQQRQQALQSYLASGQTPGDVAMNLYNQQQAQLRAGQQAALGYLGSGSTPYQAGAGYLNTAEQRAAAAAQGGPTYQPQGPSGYYTGAGTPSFPQYGLDMSQLSNQWYNSMNQWNMQAAALGQQGKSSGQRLGGAATGALSGAATGAAAGSVIPGIGTAVGAIGGALAGGLGGYFG